jgi:TonB family protein
MKNKIIVFFLSFLLVNSVHVFAQVNDNELVFSFVEQMPQFVGGEEALMKFISANVKYPQSAKEAEIEGKVIVSFIVSEVGKIEEVKVLRDIGGGCGEEALRVMSLSPDWMPGKQNGRAVRVKMVLPINFRLDTENKNLFPDTPQFPGGEESMKLFIKNNLIYPEKAKKKKMEGVCLIKVQVSKDGIISNPEIVQSLGKAFDKEALKVLNLMPKKWMPAYMDGKQKDSFVTIPFEFKISK